MVDAEAVLHAHITSMQHCKLVSREVCQILSWLLEQLAILALIDNMGTVQQGLLLVFYGCC